LLHRIQRPGGDPLQARQEAAPGSIDLARFKPVYLDELRP
jgi:hypothetical protein